VHNEWDGFDLLRNGIDLLTTRVRGRKARGTRMRREKRRACGEKVM